MAQASYLAVGTKSKKPGFGPLTWPSEPCLYREYRRRRVSLSGRSDSPWTSCLACSKRACRSDIVAFPRIGARMTARGRRRVNRPDGHLWERLKLIPQGHRPVQNPAIVAAPPPGPLNLQRQPPDASTPQEK